MESRPASNAAIERSVLASYPVVEHFYTIQGEGEWVGHAAYFVRLAGCDVGCYWCDTRYSWSPDSGTFMTADEIAAAVAVTAAQRVVVTGGEPCMHDLGPLTDTLGKAGFALHLETSGAYPPSGRFDWITLSPKRFKAPCESAYLKADELKVVIVSRKDLGWAVEQAERCGSHTRLYLQPEWDSPASIAWIVEFVKAHPEWQISVQLHKLLAIP